MRRMKYSFFAAAGPQPAALADVLPDLLSPTAPLIPAHSVRARNRYPPAGEHVFPKRALGLMVRLSPKSPQSAGV